MTIEPGTQRLRLARRLFLVTTAIAVAQTAATPLQASESAARTEAGADQGAPDRAHQEIIVTAPLFRDIRPERSLDEEAVASYGLSTVDELVGELESELGEDDEPVFIVNGQRIDSLDDLGSYPVEVIKQLQVLPRGSAPAVGGSPNQRVFTIALKDKVRSGTLTLAPRVATEGQGRAFRGEGLLTTVDGRRRGNISLRVQGESRLLESQRGIIQPTSDIPFARAGNVIAYPDLSGEIDPLLSDAAGEVVTTAPVPAGPNPTLADFAAHANQPDVTDIGPFRTLRPAVRNYDFNATYTAPLNSWLSATTRLRLGRSTSESLLGLPAGLLLLGQESPSSPFSQAVDIAVLGADPLRSRYRRNSGEGSLTLNARLGGGWNALFNAKHSESSERTRTQTADSFAPVELGDSTNPFAMDPGSLLPIATDVARSRLRTTSSDLTVSGPLFHPPAGDASLSVEGHLAWYEVHSESGFAALPTDFHRSEQSIHTVVAVPLASRRNGFLPQLGELSATAEYSRLHFSDAGAANRTAFGLTWEPREFLRFRGSIEKSRSPAPVEVLGAPAIVTPSVRIFDPLTGDTVDVTIISGGNPALRPQSTDTSRLSAILRLVPSLGLQLNGEYTDARNRNFVSSLPATSEAIMLAFPERFQRDSDGVLTLVDVRPVNFARHRQKQFRLGASLNTALSGTGRPGFSAAEGDSTPESSGTVSGPRKPPLMLQLTANHTFVSTDRILIRSGIDPVDLLDGGAIGIASGKVRHQVDATAALTSGGSGVRVGLGWVGASTLRTRIDGVDEQLRFSPFMTLNLRAFVDGRRLFPRSKLASGARLSLNVTNLTGDRQRVRDPSGTTPLQFQPAYRDPLGRTIEIEFRKVF